MKRPAERLGLDYDIRPTRERAGAAPVAAASLSAPPPEESWVVHDDYDWWPTGRVLHAQQYFRGLRVYRSVCVIKTGDTTTRATPRLYDIPPSTTTKATTTPRQAVECALAFLQRRKATRKGARLRVLRETRFSQLVETPTVIEAPRTFAEPARLHLEIFAAGKGGAEIAWVGQGELKNGIQFECVVSASRKRPRLLMCTQTNICATFQASWVRLPTEAPQADTCPIAPIASPKPVVGAPSVWLPGGDKAAGRNVVCHLLNRSSAETIGSPPVDTPFVWCNLLRDFFHEFGFEGDLYGFEGDDPLQTRRYTGEMAC